MQFFISLAPLVLGLIATTAGAAPAPAALPTDGGDNNTSPATAPTCSYNDRLGPRIAEFTSWITDCGEKGGHTTGIWLSYDIDRRVCRPLPENTRALEIQELAKGCSVRAYASPICDDYPWQPASADVNRCLWYGNNEFRSFMVACDDDTASWGR